MKLNPKVVGFGRHETFVLRYSWLSKGFKEMINDPNVFSSPEQTMTLGVGKNMVSSIRYWLLASQMMKIDKKGECKPTILGNWLLSDLDPFMEDEATLWLIHWFLASNPDMATGWYWFFNHYHKTEFTSQELGNALFEFYKENIQKSVAEKTIKQEAAIIMRMYSKSQTDKRTPLEDALDSPLSTLKLVTQAAKGKSFISIPDDRYGLPEEVLAVAIMQIFKFINQKTIPIKGLMYSNGYFPAPGAVFRMTESSLVAKLEVISRKLKIISIQETAGINQIYLNSDDIDEDIDVILHEYYNNNIIRLAA